jgi:HK97 family phage prohead protease
MRGQVEGDEVVLRGTPIVFDTPYTVRDMFGPFSETMRPTVVDDVLGRGDLDCRFLENHEGRPLARTANGTLTLTAGRNGVESEARVDTRRTDSRDLMLAVERGDITQMSCGFIVADDGDEWRVGDDGAEEREIHSFGELFDVSAVTYPASPTTSIELAQRMLWGISDESRERVRKLWAIAKDIRSGKVLSKQNGADLMAALEALHEADDEDIPSIVRSLQTINGALDKGQASLSAVLGRANPDGDPDDLQPALDPPDAEATQRAIQRQQLLAIRARELLAV